MKFLLRVEYLELRDNPNSTMEIPPIDPLIPDPTTTPIPQPAPLDPTDPAVPNIPPRPTLPPPPPPPVGGG
ncbi:MAG: hypothetical protein ACRC8S_06360 [Fimbriiglobus sp.]